MECGGGCMEHAYLRRARETHRRAQYISECKAAFFVSFSAIFCIFAFLPPHGRLNLFG